MIEFILILSLIFNYILYLLYTTSKRDAEYYMDEYIKLLKKTNDEIS